MDKSEDRLDPNVDRNSNTAPAKEQYCRPTLVSHGCLQAFTAAAVSGIPSKPPSDLRLKTKVEPLPDGALARVLALQPVVFARSKAVFAGSS